MAHLDMEKVKIYNLQCSPCEALRVGILAKWERKTISKDVESTK